MSSFVEFGTAVLKKKFLNTFNIILQCYCLLFQKGVALHIILTQGNFKSSLDEIGQAVLEKSFKIFSILLFRIYHPLEKDVAFLESP